jgi:T-complex protein 1 subunit zeta
MSGIVDEENNDLSSGKGMSLYITIAAGKGLQDIMKTNFGPHGSLKLLVNRSGEIKLTKEGSVLLREMQIQNPVASLIAKTVLAQKNFIGDGTLSKILILGEILKKMEIYLEEGIHPHVLCEGIDLSRRELERWLHTQIFFNKIDKKVLLNVAKTIMCTKLNKPLTEKISKIVVEAIMTIYQKNHEIDLNMIEIMEVESSNELDTRWVKGIVMDHGARHSDMPKLLNSAFILLCNASLEYEKTETKANYLTNSVFNNESLSAKERYIINKKVYKIIQLKRFVCKDNNRNFVVINQKGMDIIALDLLAKEGILGIRRAKKKNMERISILCNCIPINSFDELSIECLGFAGLVYEQQIQEDKYTFIENVTNPFSGTILVKGKNSMLRKQIEDCVKNSLKILKECIESKKFVEGGGKIEILASDHLLKYAKNIKGKKKLGVEGVGKALLIIPKTLLENSRNLSENSKIDFDLSLPKEDRNIDCFTVKKKIYESVCILACQLLLIDDIIIGKGLG